MSAKHLIKHFLGSIDDALRQRSQPDTASDSLPITALPDTNPASTTLAEPPFLAAHAPPMVVKSTIPLDINQDIQTILQSKNQLIDSPYKLETPQLQPFLDGTTKIALVFASTGKVLTATLQSLTDTYLLADTESSLYRHRQGETVLAVFPVSADRHYVLQSSLVELYAFRVKLQYLDPRYDIRRKVQLVTPVKLYPAPISLIQAITNYQVSIIRETTLVSGDTQRDEQESTIADLWYEAQVQGSSGRMESFEGLNSVACALDNISLGGVCLTLKNALNSQDLTHRLVLLAVSLPGIAKHKDPLTSGPLTLKVLGVIKQTRNTPSALILHIRFLRRLPLEVGRLLRRLEDHSLDEQTPLTIAVSDE